MENNNTKAIFYKQRIEVFIDTIMNIARGDYSVQLELSGDDDDLDALAMGINMMVDELKFNHDIELENERIKNLNLQLEEAKRKSEESDRLKSAFLANMSHEIRTPMNGILGFTELLKNPRLSGEEQQSYIDIIEKSGARMLNIINDIICISKIESGAVVLNIKEVNITEQQENLYTFFKPEVEVKKIAFSLKSSLSFQHSVIKTDKDKFISILANLIKNAIKYTDNGSIEFGCEKKGNYLEFYVKDTGIGITKEKHEAIFNRFIQEDIEDKMAIQGAGLGLSISKAFVEMLGGKIWVESKKGSGSTFYFTIPFNTEFINIDYTDNSFPNVVADNQIHSLKVLIVEDDEISGKLISINIKKFCKHELIAKTGNDAVEICKNNPDIDLILMDIQLPKLNGYEATRQIREFNKDVIIIAQTAYGLSGDREKSIEAGCNDYITKPIKKDELLSKIKFFFNNDKPPIN